MTGQLSFLSNLKTVAVLLLLYTAFISCAPVPDSAECVLDKGKDVDLGFEYLRDAANDVYPESSNEV